MSLTYGYDLKEGDKMLEAPHYISKTLTPLLLPGAVLINHLPFCAVYNLLRVILVASHVIFSVRHIPSWVPYFSYEPFARIVRKSSERVRNEPIDFVKNALARDDHAPSIHVD
jgi:hypothetical protein